MVLQTAAIETSLLMLTVPFDRLTLRQAQDDKKVVSWRASLSWARRREPCIPDQVRNDRNIV